MENKKYSFSKLMLDLGICKDVQGIIREYLGIDEARTKRKEDKKQAKRDRWLSRYIRLQDIVWTESDCFKKKEALDKLWISFFNMF